MNGALRCDVCGLPIGEDVTYTTKTKAGVVPFCVCEDCAEPDTESGTILTTVELDLTEEG